LVAACYASPLFQAALAELVLPEGFEAIVEPWPYGGLTATEPNKRYFQGLCFAQDTRSGNPDSNFYAYPLPLIPVMDAATKEIIRVERLATGGKGDNLTAKTHTPEIIAHCATSEYVPELLANGTRQDLKPLNVVQPDGASFSVDGGLIEWQKWRFRVGFNPREGATIHDVTYDGRSVLYRLSVSEMVSFVPTPSHVTERNFTESWNRLFHTLTHAHHSTESKHSTLVMEVLETVPTTSPWVVTALVLLRYLFLIVLTKSVSN
jgi:primary-amine oxidase